jgi:hypothetical protein
MPYVTIETVNAQGVASGSVHYMVTDHYSCCALARRMNGTRCPVHPAQPLTWVPLCTWGRPIRARLASLPEATCRRCVALASRI